ncbi:MAG: ATP-dependent DNA helicase [Candidatus Korobacteraceae bacterium]
MSWKPRKFELTPDQQKAVNHGEGPILVVAGAGTGKTTVLASRVVRLIEDKLADPREILAVTYTRNSAHDLMKRIARLWKGSDDTASLAQVAESGLKIGTFHAYCFKLLRDAGQRFDLIDDIDLYVLLRRNQEDLKLQYYVKAATPGQFLDGLGDFFERCHDELRTPEDYDDYVAKLESKQIPLPRVMRGGQAETMTEDEVLGRCHEIARIFHHVEDMLAAENLGTYSHVITRAIRLLRDPKNAAHLERARESARFVLVDEFQDSNVAQIELTRLLAGEKASVFAVGDPDQAIYRFRGATAGTFDHFLRTFGVERVKRVTMSENRRSTDFILRSAYSVISHNPQITSVELPGGERWEREPLRPMRKAMPKPVLPVRIKAWDDAASEAAFVAGEIERMHSEGRPWGDFAVLYRNHSHCNALVEELLERSIPLGVTGLDLLSTPGVRDMLAGLRAVMGGDAVSLLRVTALPVFKVDGEELRTVLAAAEKGCALESSLEKVSGGSNVITVLAEVRHHIQRLQNKALAACGIVQNHFGITASPDTAAFTEFVQGWSRKPRQISAEGTLSEFLEYLDYFTEGKGRVTAPEEADEETPASLQMEFGQTQGPQRQDDAVRLMSTHTAKGLEFPVVFVMRATHPSFPSSYREELVEFPNELRDRDTRFEDDAKEAHKQEERRLFYVAMTRAEDALVLCGKKGTGKKDPTPPGYLRDLVAAGEKALRGCIEYGTVSRGELVGDIHASAAPLPRIIEWMGLPALQQTTTRRLSASAIERYERCPLSYKLAAEWKLPEAPAANLQYGAAMHSALLACFDALRKGRPMSVDEVVRYFLDQFAKAKIDDPTQRRLYERDGAMQLQLFLESRAAQPYGKVAMLEHSFHCEVAGTPVAGRIDRVDEDEDGYVIVDYKTGNPKSQDLADRSLQLSIYALAMSASKPVKLLVFQNLGDNSAVVTLRSPESLRKAETRIAAAASGIAAGEFEPTPGTHCNWCGYRTICPEKEVRPRLPMGASAEPNGQLRIWAE